MKKIISSITNILNAMAGLSLILMMILCILNIFLRLLGHPLKGTFELMGFLGAIACSLSLAGTEKSGGHIHVGILFDKLSKGLQKVFGIIGWIGSITLLVLICYKLITLGMSIKGFGELSETLNISYYPVIFICAVGFFFAILVILLNILENFQKK